MPGVDVCSLEREIERGYHVRVYQSECCFSEYKNPPGYQWKIPQEKYCGLGYRPANRAREKMNPTETSALNMMIDVNFKTMIHHRRLRSSANGKAVCKWGIGKPRRGYDPNLGGVGEADFCEWHIRGTPDRQ